MEQQEIIETQKRIIDTISYGVQEAIIITDPNRIITHFNKAAEEVTRTNVVDAIGKKVDEVVKIHDENGEISMDQCCPIGNLDIHGIVFEKKEIKLSTPDNQENIVSVKVHKVKGGSEVNLGCIMFIEDTFEQSDLERTKLDFVSMSEHVLRTPITIIRGYISRMLEERTTSKLDESEINYLNSAFLGTTELLTLIEDLLNITEIRKEGGLKLNKTAINIESLVSKVVSEFKIVAAEKGLQIIFIPPLYTLPMVDADISKLKIVFQNLIENSIKYTNQGKIEVILSKQEGNIQIAIKDQGRGIPEEYIPQLFTKFYRVKKALVMDYGMGLGLYIAKKIVRAHKGNIWVESKPDQGATFYFTLPVTEE